MDPALDVIGRILQLIIGGVFVAAGLLKLYGRGMFSMEVSGYTWVPGGIRPLLVWAVPILEVSVGAMLISGIGSLYTLGGAAVVLMLFSGAIGVQLARGSVADCGCFGPHLLFLSRGRRVLLRNGVLLAINLTALLLVGMYPG